MTKQAILTAENVSIQFGGLKAVSNFNLEVYSRELIGLIGPNGAGKTTIFNMISGIFPPTEGRLLLEGKEFGKKTTSQLVQAGIVRTFQNIRLFDHMSVLENVLAAYNFHMNYNYFQGVFRSKKYWEEEKQAKELSLKLLKIFDLDGLAHQPAGSLSYGQQRKLEIIRALATDPKLLLLDEPAAGMNPKETEDLMKTIQFIRDTFDLAILLIEHDMKLVLGICEELIVLDRGEIIAQGDPLETVQNERVIAAYLGEGAGGE